MPPPTLTPLLCLARARSEDEEEEEEAKSEAEAVAADKELKIRVDGQELQEVSPWTCAHAYTPVQVAAQPTCLCPSLRLCPRLLLHLHLHLSMGMGMGQAMQPAEPARIGWQLGSTCSHVPMTF